MHNKVVLQTFFSYYERFLRNQTQSETFLLAFLVSRNFKDRIEIFIKFYTGLRRKLKEAEKNKEIQIIELKLNETNSGPKTFLFFSLGWRHF